MATASGYGPRSCTWGAAWPSFTRARSYLVDGLALAELDLRALRGRIGAVTQQAALVDASIADNITLGAGPLAPDALARAIADAALTPDLAITSEPPAADPTDPAERPDASPRDLVRRADSLRAGMARLVADQRIPDALIVGIWNNGPLRHSEYFPQKFLPFMTPVARQEAQEVHLLANLGDQGEGNTGCNAKLQGIKARAARNRSLDLHHGAEGGRLTRQHKEERQDQQHQPQGLRPFVQAVDCRDPVKNDGYDHDRTDDVAQP